MDDANELIEKQKEKLQNKVRKLDEKTGELNTELANLKVELYGKIGTNINLEEGMRNDVLKLLNSLLLFCLFMLTNSFMLALFLFGF